MELLDFILNVMERWESNMAVAINPAISLCLQKCRRSFVKFSIIQRRT
jgi:hypothetical protein